MMHTANLVGFEDAEEAGGDEIFVGYDIVWVRLACKCMVLHDYTKESGDAISE